MAGAVQGRWSDHTTTVLFENLRPKESLWNLKVEAYGNKSSVCQVVEHKNPVTLSMTMSMGFYV